VPKTVEDAAVMAAATIVAKQVAEDNDMFD
jgi:hypothetical protein